MYRHINLETRLSADPNARAKLIYCSYPNGYRLHRHSFFEITFVTSGEGLHIVNGEPYRFRKGDICLFSPSTLHQFLPVEGAEPLTMYTISFLPEPIRAEFWAHVPTQDLPIITRLDAENYAVILQTFEKLYKRASKESLPFDLYTQTAIEWIILNMLEFLPEPLSPDYMKIRPALIFIQSNFSEQITLADAAASAYFSREYFSGLFRRTMGVSFQQYLLDLRLEYASNLLALTSLTVTELSEQSGFLTLSYFIRAFRRRNHMSPSAFREMRRKQGIQPLPLL